MNSSAISRIPLSLSSPPLSGSVSSCSLLSTSIAVSIVYISREFYFFRIFYLFIFIQILYTKLLSTHTLRRTFHVWNDDIWRQSIAFAPMTSNANRFFYNTICVVHTAAQLHIRVAQARATRVYFSSFMFIIIYYWMKTKNRFHNTREHIFFLRNRALWDYQMTPATVVDVRGTTHTQFRLKQNGKAPSRKQFRQTFYFLFPPLAFTPSRPFTECILFERYRILI